LREMVVIIDPCVNPDGYARYVNWYHQTVGNPPNALRDTWEHREPWPSGRFNHYLFDLNRDWAWQTQIENQQRLALYRQWMPHVHADFHEMSYLDSYFFAPAARPYHEALSEWQRKFQQLAGENHSRYFNENNWLYFTREVYDLFYPSYGDTWPSFNGAMGFTYEQGGSGTAGLAIKRADQDTLTLSNRYLHHYFVGLSTVEVAYQNREELIREF
ncbi:MAG: zinc carboxypeptidase, partial [Bacteroidia bacterium]|nr:zinc carboxypeptidase [Bacteroidia bacterium]